MFFFHDSTIVNSYELLCFTFSLSSLNTFIRRIPLPFFETFPIIEYSSVTKKFEAFSFRLWNFNFPLSRASRKRSYRRSSDNALPRTKYGYSIQTSVFRGLLFEGRQRQRDRNERKGKEEERDVWLTNRNQSAQLSGDSIISFWSRPFFSMMRSLKLNGTKIIYGVRK